MQSSRKQNYRIRFIKLPIAKIIGLIALLQIEVACTPFKAMMTPSIESNISEVTAQLRTINDADTQHYLKTNNGTSVANLVKDGLLTDVPQPPQNTGSKYSTSWKTAPTGTNKNKEVEYIELLGVSDEFCKAWNNAKHPELGKVIMPNCQQAKPPYSCDANKPGIEIQDNSPSDQCGQTCCVVGNVILYRNGYINKTD